jgi:hypothetical protein
MAFENPSSTNTPQPAPKTKKQPYILAALVIILLGTWGYIIWDKQQSNATISQQAQQITIGLSQQDSLKLKLAAEDDAFDALKSTDVQKDSQLAEKDKEIEQDKAEADKYLKKDHLDAAGLAKAKKLIASLQEEIEGYKTEIETLKNENTQLTTEKEQVTAERDQVQKDLDSSSTVVKKQSDVINLGSTLHISNFAIEGIQDKKNGKEKATTDAKKIDKLHITFDIDENLISATETKSLYILITAPNGKLITVGSLGSGEFTTRDGQTMLYTQKVDVDYVQGKKLPVSTYWKQTTPFAIGDYKIVVYNNGLKVGEGTVLLKKGGIFG